MPGPLLVPLVSLLLAGGTGPATAGQRSNERASSPPVDLVWMSGPIAEAKPTAPRPASTAKLRGLGAKLYASKCASCHGTRGDGRGPEAARLDVPPRDFTSGVYKLRSTPTGRLPTDEDLFVTLTRGLHGTPMFPYPRLGEEERWALVEQLQRFSVRFREERPGPTIEVPKPPVETDALRAQGAKLYTLARCGACHGAEGTGQGAAATLYKNEPAERRVRIRDFTHGRFVRSPEMTDLYLTLRTGLDGSPMGAYDTLTDAEIWALAAYVRTLVREWPLPDQSPTPATVRPGGGDVPLR